MEHEYRPAVATFYAPDVWTPEMLLPEAAAHHARVKRLAVRDVVRLTSGDGRRVNGVLEEIGKRALTVSINVAGVEYVPEPAYVELWAPVGDRDRMLWLAEKAVELGVSSWQPVVYARSRSVAARGEGEAFRAKLRARQIGALEQCGGAWLPKSNHERTLHELLGDTTDGVRARTLVMLDGDGEPMTEILSQLACPLRIAVGPEGGFDDEERSAFARGSWRAVSLAANVLRFETAGLAALAIARSHFR